MRFLTSVLLLLLAPVSVAQTLVVGLSSADYPPYYFNSDQGLQGAAVSIAEDLADELGYQLSYKRYPWKRVQHNLRTGVVDMVLVYFKTPERARDVVYTEQPHLSEKASLFVSDNMQVAFNGRLSDLADYQFFGVRGYFYGEQYANLDTLRKGDVSDEAELVRRIANPNFDLIGIGNQPAIEYYARQQGLESRLKFLQPAIFEGYNYFAFSRARPDATQVARRFSEALQDYMQTARYRSLLRRYGLQPPGKE